MGQQRVQLQKTGTKRSPRTADRSGETPASERREIRKDIARTWWPTD